MTEKLTEILTEILTILSGKMMVTYPDLTYRSQT